MDSAEPALARLPGLAREAPAETVADAPFMLIEPLHRATPLILSSPHSGRRYPADLIAATRLPLMSLRRSEDAYVDELFAGAAAFGAPVLCAAVARAYVDLNRDPAELDPAMFFDPPPRATWPPSQRVQAGLGVLPRIAGDGEDIYRRRMPLAEAERRLLAVHRPYHVTLAGLIAESRTLFGKAVLLDCHSMPSSARGARDADIVLGDRFGAACHPDLTALVEQTLRAMGYRVSRNAPFAGGHTTQSYGRPTAAVHALQIELNRGLYLQERSLTRSSGFDRVRADMTRLIETLVSVECGLR